MKEVYRLTAVVKEMQEKLNMKIDNIENDDRERVGNTVTQKEQICETEKQMRGRRVRVTSIDPVADNTDEEQQLIEGRSYADTVAKGKERKVRVVMGDSIVRKLDKIINRGSDVTVCLPGAKIEDVTERVGHVMGNGYGGSILVHVGTNNAEKEGTTAIIEKYRKLVCTLKGVRVGQIVLSGILPIMGSRGKYYKNCRRMAINTLLHKLCMEEGIGFVDVWASFEEREDMFMNDVLHLSGKGAAVMGSEFIMCINEGTGTVECLN